MELDLAYYYKELEEALFEGFGKQATKSESIRVDSRIRITFSYDIVVGGDSECSVRVEYSEDDESRVRVMYKGGDPAVYGISWVANRPSVQGKACFHDSMQEATPESFVLWSKYMTKACFLKLCAVPLRLPSVKHVRHVEPSRCYGCDTPINDSVRAVAYVVVDTQETCCLCNSCDETASFDNLELA